jgi:hypothetical protein
MGQHNIEPIKEWYAPRLLTDVQSFLVFANVYQRFIKNFLRIRQHLIESIKRETMDWHWRLEIDKSFEELENQFTTVPILCHFDPSKRYSIETDDWHFDLREILLHKANKGRLHLIAFHLWKFHPIDINYAIDDKEPLVIIYSFKV